MRTNYNDNGKPAIIIVRKTKSSTQSAILPNLCENFYGVLINCANGVWRFKPFLPESFHNNLSRKTVENLRRQFHVYNASHNFILQFPLDVPSRFQN